MYVLLIKKNGDLIPPLIYLNNSFFNSFSLTLFSKTTDVKFPSNRNFSYLVLEKLLFSSWNNFCSLIFLANILSDIEIFKSLISISTIDTDINWDRICSRISLFIFSLIKSCEIFELLINSEKSFVETL